jgi:3'-phosphoadenosine 5'-phosphosulfate sulfotransferase (PAPS reductase)/FAD synthetase
VANRTRHILGLSGGKDSTGLLVLLRDAIPQMEYFFCDTGKELPETYEYLEKVESRYGIKVERLSANQDFDFWLERGGGYLPSPRQRWCTINLKIKPLEKFVGEDNVYSYVGIREDENRLGYLSTKPNVKAIYPYKSQSFVAKDKQGKITYDQSVVIQEFKKLNIDLPIAKSGYSIDDVRNLLDESGVGMPDYYRWRSRSGCYFCFFQRKYEWVMLAQEYPDLFEKAVAYEQNHKDGRKYYWSEDESLLELIARKDEIIANHNIQMEKGEKSQPKKSLADTLADVLDFEDDSVPCLACNI